MADTYITVEGDTVVVTVLEQGLPGPGSDALVEQHNSDEEAHPYILDLIDDIKIDPDSISEAVNEYLIANPLYIDGGTFN